MSFQTSLPPPLRRGSRVGVAALSGPVEPSRLQRGLQQLRDLGYEPVSAPNLASSFRVFAGTDEERLAGFHVLASDPKVEAIFFARGGHGAMRVLDGIDWQLLERYPRAYVGYSDVTPFLLGVVARLGLVAFHGPMVAVELARGLATVEAESLQGALEGRLPMRVPAGESFGGELHGQLVGGCLSLLTSTLGTTQGTDLKDTVLFWEDVDEPFYRLDRMLTHLRLSGTLSGIRGMVAGSVNWGDRDPEDATYLRELLRDLADELGIPVVTGVPSGHTAPNYTLPLSLSVRRENPSNDLFFDIA